MNFDWFLTQAALPEIALAASILLILLVGAFVKDRMAPKVVWRLTLLSFIGTFTLVLQSAELSQIFAFPRIAEPGNLSAHALFINDGFAVFSKALMLVFAALCLFFAKDYMLKKKIVSFEYYILMMLATLGGMILISAHDMLTFYLGLELMSFSLYVMAAYHRRSLKSSESGLKYFLLGSLASGFMLYGMSLFYGLTGNTSFETIQLALMNEQLMTDQRMMVSLALVMMLVGMLFKVSAAPFHVWTPDVYEGAPTPVTGFMAVVPKVASFAALIRLLAEPLAPMLTDWQPILMIVAVLTMGIGSIVAGRQTSLKRLLAYSAISHSGFMLVPLLTGTTDGFAAVMIYLTIYGFTVIGIFATILSFRNRKVFVETIDDMRGLAKQAPGLAFTLMLLLFSLAGIPPLAGIFAKFFAFKAAVDAGFIEVVIIAVIFSVVACYYSLKLIKAMYFEEGGKTLSPDFPCSLRYTAVIMGVMIIAISIFADVLIGFTENASNELYRGYNENVASVSFETTTQDAS